MYRSLLPEGLFVGEMEFFFFFLDEDELELGLLGGVEGVGGFGLGVLEFCVDEVYFVLEFAEVGFELVGEVLEGGLEVVVVELEEAQLVVHGVGEREADAVVHFIIALTGFFSGK